MQEVYVPGRHMYVPGRPGTVPGRHMYVPGRPGTVPGRHMYVPKCPRKKKRLLATPAGSLCVVGGSAQNYFIRLKIFWA